MNRLLSLGILLPRGRAKKGKSPYLSQECSIHNCLTFADNTHMKMALYGRQPETELFSACESAVRSQTPTWLPGLMSQSVLLWDQSRVEMKRVAKGHTRIALMTS